MLTKLLIYVSLIIGALGQVYEDRRCRCICPSPAQVMNQTRIPETRQIISDVPASQCNCVTVVMPRVAAEVRGRESEYCLHCDCKYETRNSAIIKVVVITLVWLVMLLLVYSLFLLCLAPLMKTRRVDYKDHPLDESQHLLDDFEDH